MEKISFIILHYGEVSVTAECIRAIEKLQGRESVNIVVLDNDSQKTKEERMELQRLYQDKEYIDIVVLEDNAGFSRANNIGYSYVINNYHPNYIVVLNNDIIIKQEDFIKRIVSCYEQSSFSVLSPDVVSMKDGAHQSPIDTQERTLKQLDYTINMNKICLKLFPVVYPFLVLNNKIAYSLSRKKKSESSEYQKDIVPCGACIILSKDFISKEEQLFSPETQFYYEEYILHYQCEKKGYGIVYNPEIVVLHGDGVATSGKSKNYKNKLRFMMTHTMESAKVYRELIKNEE